MLQLKILPSLKLSTFLQKDATYYFLNKLFYFFKYIPDTMCLFLQLAIDYYF